MAEKTKTRRLDELKTRFQAGAKLTIDRICRERVYPMRFIFEDFKLLFT